MIKPLTWLIRQFIHFFIEYVILLSYILPSFFFTIIIIGHTLNLLLPEYNFFKDTLISATGSDMKLLTSEAFILIGIGIFLKVRLKKMKLVLPLFQPSNLRAAYILSSIFLSYFFLNNVISLSKMWPILILFSTIFFFFYLPQVVEFYTTFNMAYFKNFILFYKNFSGVPGIDLPAFPRFRWKISLKRDNYFTMPHLDITWPAWKINWKRVFLNFIISTTVFVIVTALTISIVIFISRSVFSYLEFQRSQREKLLISEFIPRKVIYADEVTIEGYNFGFKANDKFRVQTSYGPVDTNLWTNEKIIFTAPLHWKEGPVNLWIERTAEDSSKSAVIRSNSKELTVLSRWDFYPEERDYEAPGLLYWRIFTKKIKELVFLKLRLFQ